MLPLRRDSYIGRFAPSPSGPLHFGSLVAALASYLDARAHQGRWLVRIEDVDTPRCLPGADNLILRCLEAHSLLWDGEVVYQSSRTDSYAAAIHALQKDEKIYFCTCTRKIIKLAGGVYPGSCRVADNDHRGAAVRFRMGEPVTRFEDRILGTVTITDPHALEDTILKRRDGLFAYNLAVVVDDIHQGITHIVRGSDLLSTTAAHLSLYRALKKPAPCYAHIPVAVEEPGRKLSKQNHAAPLNLSTAADNLRQALVFLKMPLPRDYINASCEQLLNWAINHWDCKNIPKQTEIIVQSQESPYHNGPWKCGE